MKIRPTFRHIVQRFSTRWKASTLSNFLSGGRRHNSVPTAHIPTTENTITNPMKDKNTPPNSAEFAGALSGSNDNFKPDAMRDGAGLPADVVLANQAIAWETKGLEAGQVPQVPREAFQRTPPPAPAPTPEVPSGGIYDELDRRQAKTQPQTRVGGAMVAPPAPQPPPASNESQNPLLLFSGRFKSGKDFVAEAAGAKIFSFADPLYALLEEFFGTTDKNVPGAREFLQTVGQWGRGHVDGNYPLSPQRALFVQLMRSLPMDHFGQCVAWTDFGRTADIWLEACAARVKAHLDASTAVTNLQRRCAITNARFENELGHFRNAGWVHWHVMCSPRTWTDRLKAAGLDPQSTAARDTSEQMALRLDAQVMKTIAHQPRGPMLRVIWSDDKVATPSPRIFTVNQWLQHITILDEKLSS
jgi:hypothetical protein